MIKKFVLGISALALALSVGAGVKYPYLVMSDFVVNDDGLPSDWVTYGITDEPSKYYQDLNLFPSYKTGPWYEIMKPDGYPATAFSCSSFSTMAKSDQWLISPGFSSDYDDLIVTFKVLSLGAAWESKFEVYCSEKGIAKEDFKADPPVYSGEVAGKENGVVSTSHAMILENCKGKDLNLAFVNVGNRSGLLGFSDIVVGPYLIEVQNQDKLNGIILDEDNPYLTLTVKVRTTVECNGITATLKTDKTSNSSTYTSDAVINENGYTTFNISFPDKINLEGLESDNFTVTVTPNYEGAPSTEISGLFVGSMNLYDGVAVVEDLTGTWCPNCVRAICIMDYFKGTYPALDGKTRFVGIAAHGGEDPMAIVDYYMPLYTLAGNLTGGEVGYPMYVRNRKLAKSPGQSNMGTITRFVDDVVNEKVNANVKILSSSVTGDGNSAIVEVKGQIVAAMEGESNFNAVLMILENNVVGNNSNYNQQNNMLFGQTFVEQYFGPGSYAKYFEKYDRKGTIKYTEMKYQDVCRGVFPKYEGYQLMSPIKFNIPQTYTWRFNMPEVNNRAECEVVVLLTDRTTGQIISADIRKLGVTTGVESVEQDDNGDTVIKVTDGNIRVFASEEGTADVYTLDGRTVWSGRVSHGFNTISVDHKGMLLVKVNTHGVQRSAKVIL